MAELNVAQLTTEILSGITSYLVLEDLLSFLRASNVLLSKKLRQQGGIRTITACQSDGFFERLAPCNPRLVANSPSKGLICWSPQQPYPFCHLTSFVWAQKSKTLFLHFLPPTLTNLDIESPNILLLTLPYLTNSPISVVSGQPSQIYSLQGLFPELLSLTLSRRQTTIRTAIEEGSHPSLQLPEVLKSLPRSLQKLHTCLFSSRFLFENATYLPSGLTSLGIWVTYESPTDILENVSPTAHPELCALLRQLTRFDLPSYRPVDGSLFRLFGEGLEHLSLQSMPLSAIAFLPQTLTNLTLQYAVTIDKGTSTDSPQAYLSMARANLKWPPRLRVFRQVSIGTPLVYPHAIDTLELCAKMEEKVASVNILSIALHLDALFVLKIPAVTLPDTAILDLPRTLQELHVYSIRQTGYLALPGHIPAVWDTGSAAICASQFLATQPIRVFFSSLYHHFICDSLALIPDGVERLDGINILNLDRIRFPPSLTVASAQMRLGDLPVHKYPPNLVEIESSLSLRLSDIPSLPLSLRKVKLIKVELEHFRDWETLLREDTETLVFRDGIPALIKQSYLPHVETEIEISSGWYTGTDYLPPNLKKLVVKKNAYFPIPPEQPLPHGLTHLEIHESLELRRPISDFYDLPHLSILKLGNSTGKDFLFFGDKNMVLPSLQSLEIFGGKAVVTTPNELRKMTPALTSLYLKCRLLISDSMLETLLPTTLTHAEINAPFLSEEAAKWLPSSLTTLTLAYDSSITSAELLSLRPKKP